MGYGLPLGVDSRQAGIGALVTVATLKTSEGSGKTQTQCLFLRTEKGSCLYSAAKPNSGVTTSAASSVVGGWLRGKTGVGGGRRDTPAGPTPPAQTGANRVRVRSGRRWRKSDNAACREKTGVSRERQQRSREVPAGEIAVEERQEEQDKGGLDCKQFPTPQQDSRRARCSHSVSPKSCVQCGRRAQRRKSQDGHEGGIPNRLNSEVTGMRKERQKNEEEDKGGLGKLESSSSVLTELNPDLESTRSYSDSHDSCDVGETRETESSEGQKTQASQSKDGYSEEQGDRYTEGNIVTHGHSGLTDNLRHKNSVTERKPSECPREEEEGANVNGFSDLDEAGEESEKRAECADVKDEKENISEALDEFSSWCAVFTPASSSTAVSLTFNKSAAPIEGSVCSADRETCWVQAEQENHVEGYEQEEENSEVEEQANEKTTVNEVLHNKPQSVFKNEEEVLPSPLTDGDHSISESGERIVADKSSKCGTKDELESEEGNLEESLNPEHGDGPGEIRKSDECKGEVTLKDSYEGTEINRASEEDWRLQEVEDEHRKWEEEDGYTCAQTSNAPVEPSGETNITNTACTNLPTSPALSQANPAPSLPTLGSMATGLPCQEREEEEEEEAVSATAGDREGGQEGKRRELEEQGEVESGSTVATDEGRKEEEEDEFGVFMQAEGEPAWSEEFTMSASVPCGSRESVGESRGCSFSVPFCVYEPGFPLILVSLSLLWDLW